MIKAIKERIGIHILFFGLSLLRMDMQLLIATTIKNYVEEKTIEDRQA